MFEKTNIETVFQYTAVLLTCFGLYCLSLQLLNPFTLPGAIAYTFTGIVFTVFAYKIHLPSSLYHLLYQQSLLDFLLEPSPYANLYFVLTLSIILPPEQIKRYIKLLPSEMNFVIRPGMIHLLPEGIQTFINNIVTFEAIQAIDHEGISNETSNSNEPKVIEGGESPSIYTVIYTELKMKITRYVPLVNLQPNLTYFEQPLPKILFWGKLFYVIFSRYISGWVERCLLSGTRGNKDTKSGCCDALRHCACFVHRACLHVIGSTGL